MSEKTVNRSELPDDYAEMMKTESHHQHEVIKDAHGVLRWKADPFVRKFTDGCNLNNIVQGLYANGNDKNSELYRELYRRMGYSLSGYWEIFYWEVNNEDADQYVPNAR